MEITVTPGTGRGKRKSRNVAISGAMTIYSAAAAKNTLLDALDVTAHIEIDLSEVVEMDTAGVQLLVLLKREAAAIGKRVSLAGHSIAVLEVFDCYRLSAYFGDPVLFSGGNR
jgi:anti-sigma B factor antagonist